MIKKVHTYDIMPICMNFRIVFASKVMHYG